MRVKKKKCAKKVLEVIGWDETKQRVIKDNPRSNKTLRGKGGPHNSFEYDE